MKRHLFAIAAATALAACATAPKPPTTAELLVGKWECAGKVGPADMTEDVTYATGGTSTMKLSAAMQQGAMNVALSGTGAGTWALNEGDQLEETVTDVKIDSASVNGKEVGVAMFQGLLAQALDKPTTSSVAVTKTDLTLTQTGVAEGAKPVVRTCKR
ncbi:MAG: hypothetical protein GC155_00790 [Alphaproteobacteria bacterium]|nr:hypothetical protein [Alphaproteobacteria bacterium]